MTNEPVTSPLTNPALHEPYQKRQFVPADADLCDLTTVNDLYQQLTQRTLSNQTELDQFIDDRCELDSAIDQQQSVLYIGMTCQTCDSQIAKSYQQFISTIEPAVRPWEDQLNRKTLEALVALQIDDPYFEVYFKNLQADAKLYCPENIALYKQEALAKQEYQSIYGAMTVEFRQQEYTMAQMAAFLQDPDRNTRQQAWQAQAERRLRDSEVLETLFDRLRSLRVDIARNANQNNYRDFKFIEYHRFDYTAEDCQAFHQAVADHIVPLYKDIQTRRCLEMGFDTLRPWDLDTDPQGRKPLKPFDSVNRLIEGVHTIFGRLDSELADQFDSLRHEGLLDLESRKGKAPGGYQCSLAESRKPFIFMNAAGTDRDLIVLLHESGHAFHTFACRDQRLLPYRHAPMEFCEVASMAMELLGRTYLDEFYSPDDLKRYRHKQLEQIVQILCWIATVDAFQHWLYQNESHSPAQRAETWLQLHHQYISHCVDWSGLEHIQRQLWHQQLHIFLYPFYYIEYGIAQLGALGIWQRFQTDPAAALKDYKKALALGSSVPLKQLFKTAGLNLDFSAQSIAPAAALIRKELEL